MDLFAIVFPAAMLGMAAVFTAILWWAAGIWGALGFMTVLALLWIVFGRATGGTLNRETLNAFQKPLAKDDD